MTLIPADGRPKARLAALAAGAALLVLGSATASAAGDPMLALATRSGCMQCHAVGTQTSTLEEGLPVGPSWQEVAARYQGQRGVAARLVRAVRSGSNPQRVHWRGQVAGKAMPPNAVAISEADARRLVRWILAL